MRKAVFSDGGLVRFLKEVTEEVNCLRKEGNNNKNNVCFRKGNLGHVTRIGNAIQRLCENNSEIGEYVESIIVVVVGVNLFIELIDIEDVWDEFR